VAEKVPIPGPEPGVRSSRTGFCLGLWVAACTLVLAQPSPLPSPDTFLPATPETLTIQQLDQQIRENQSELDRTRQRLAEIEKQLGDLSGREQASLSRLASLQEQISVTRSYLARLRSQAAARSNEIAQVAREMQETQAEAEVRKEELDRRLNSIYKYGRTSPLTALLSTRSVPEVYRKMTYLRWVVRADQRLAAELKELNSRLHAQRARLVAARTELERLQREQLDQEAKLSSAIADESSLLKKVRGEKEARQELQRQLSESAARLQNLLVDLQRRKEQAQPETVTEFGAEKGKLPWPLRGKIIAAFGSQVHPRYKTKTSNLGIDIKAEPTSAVRAVASGRVAYADQFRGYGNLVIVDHGGGFYTLYANLTDMSAQVGTAVAAGTKVGSVADYLHFEIRRDGKAVDPVDWLVP
jgi:septal ring factor EnvC (AmiA/AmiB activator)